MKIRSVQVRVVEIPFEDGGPAKTITPLTWHSLETVLVRVEDTDGNVGWGEAFGYFIADATASVIEARIKPLLEGAEIASIEEWNRRTQQQLHLFGRYGITTFAISGVDMALWDLLAKRRRVPLFSVFGASNKRTLTTYASLVRYGTPEMASSICAQALDEGYEDIKLHEADMRVIDACHRTVAGRAGISIDVNCGWERDVARANVDALAKHDRITWVEEPIFPPEDFAALASLRARGVPIAAGENWCTEVQFRHAMDAGAVDYIQPSVSKVGGVTEFVNIAREAQKRDVGVLPHSPYFGPGFLATLHLAIAFSTLQLEYLYVKPAAELIDLSSIRRGPAFDLLDEPGIGLSPDEAVVTRFVRAR
ncbi:mandelate racemase/muconate lactonizing protein [Caballeronia hypogeia]|uniref:Mandelate racemase/muconate lactonizing protein n=1 Tax=Caballeronia hypogeia TaxID=1777140 RepID=A0A158AF08_9BURK|nr:mandelate racemase/muconate lactonizing enzyme family protein [Caballeronia hypogeia]SAK56299.1 mandelate racemase/muconate lactonizing protein [Caballeronia hypogeia]